jgi:hypothetical protein
VNYGHVMAVEQVASQSFKHVLIQIYAAFGPLASVPLAFEETLGDRKRGNTKLGGNAKLV